MKSMFALTIASALVGVACSAPDQPTETVASSQESALTVYTSGSSNNCATLTLNALYGASTDGASANTVYGYINAAQTELNLAPNAAGGDSYYPTLIAKCGAAITNSQNSMSAAHAVYDIYHLDNATVSNDSTQRMYTVITNLAACSPAVLVDSGFHPSTMVHNQNVTAYVHRAVELANQAAYKAEYCYMKGGGVTMNASPPTGSFTCSGL